MVTLSAWRCGLGKPTLPPTPPCGLYICLKYMSLSHSLPVQPVVMEVLKMLIFLSLLNILYACLITNCPKGGKRSSPPLSYYHRFRPELANRKEAIVSCRRCGPNQEGRCISSAICCGPKIGCLFGTPAILPQCSEQSSLPPPTLPRQTKACSIGYCVSDAVCCSTDGCKMDMTCEMETTTDLCSSSIETNIF